MTNILRYKDYIGTVNFSEEDGVFFGSVFGITDSISFEGDSVQSLKEDFHNAIDEYLEFCKEVGKTPQKSYKGSFSIRISPELHRSTAFYAASQGQSLNSTVEEALRQYMTTRQHLSD